MSIYSFGASGRSGSKATDGPATALQWHRPNKRKRKKYKSEQPVPSSTCPPEQALKVHGGDGQACRVPVRACLPGSPSPRARRSGSCRTAGVVEPRGASAAPALASPPSALRDAALVEPCSGAGRLVDCALRSGVVAQCTEALISGLCAGHAVLALASFGKRRAGPPPAS